MRHIESDKSVIFSPLCSFVPFVVNKRGSF